MKINPISMSVYNHTKTQAFNGSWSNQNVYNGSSTRVSPKRIYTPDKGETSRQIAKAWEEETGYAPIDWVRIYNPFAKATSNQQFEHTVSEKYEIAGHSYMPVDVLIASVKMKQENDVYAKDSIDYSLELAKLYKLKQNGCKEQRKFERRMIENYLDTNSNRLKNIAVNKLNDYYPGWGDRVKAIDVYGTRPLEDVYKIPEELMAE